MDLKDLKKTWNRFSAGKELDEDQLREVLRRRTGSLIERIDRNVRIGYIILFVLILLFLADDFIFAPILAGKAEAEAAMPIWLIYVSIFSNLLLFFTFMYFVYKYYKVRKMCNISCNLRETLVKIIKTLRLYKRLFYFALIVFALALALQFLSGMYTGMAHDIKTQGIALSEIPFNRWILITLTGLVVLVLSVGGLYLLMRWGFRRLYGNYINKLKHTLNELDEMGA